MPDYAAHYSDGRGAAPRPIRARIEGPSLVIRDVAGQDLDTWSLAELHLIDALSPHSAGQLGRARGQPEYLTFQDPLFAVAIAPYIGRAQGGEQSKAKAAILWLVVALTGLAVILIALSPFFAPQIAAALPPPLAARAGDRIAAAAIAQVAQAAGRTPALCTNTAGVVALRHLTTRLAAVARPPANLSVQVVDVPYVGAAALPGGRILIFRGLIDFALNSDELASLLAHEIAHAEFRHPMEAALARSTTGLLGVLFGDGGLSRPVDLAPSLFGAAYGSEAEKAAGARAAEILAAAKFDPHVFPAFMERIERRARDRAGPLYHASALRPASAQSARTTAPSSQALPGQAWRELKAICAR